MHLLNLDSTLDNAADQHELATAPLLTRAAYEASGLAQKNSQYGVLGSVTAIWSVSSVKIASANCLPEAKRAVTRATTTPLKIPVCISTP